MQPQMVAAASIAASAEAGVGAAGQEIRSSLQRRRQRAAPDGMQGADTSQLPSGPPTQQHGDFVQANGYADPAVAPASVPAHSHNHGASQLQAHDAAWQQYYQQQQQQSQAQLQLQPPSAAVSAVQGGAAWQPQLQRPADWPQAQQSTDAVAQPYESGPTPPLPDEPPVRPSDQPPLPDTPQPPPVPPQPQWPQPVSTPPVDAAQQQQWPQQQWATPPQQQQHWPADAQQQYWQQQGLQQPTWDGSHAMYAQTGVYAAPNGAYQYPQYQQWQQPYQQPAAYSQPHQQHPQYAAYGAWPAASAPYGAAQPPQQHQVPQSTPAAWQPAASAAAAQYAPAITRCTLSASHLDCSTEFSALSAHALHSVVPCHQLSCSSAVRVRIWRPSALLELL
jgi:hypothetical protein